MKPTLFLSALALAMMCVVQVHATTDPVNTEGEEEKTLLQAEVMPEYNGGMEALFAYISQNVNYPEDAKKAGKEGRVLCSFIVSKTGKVTNVRIVRSCGTKSLDDEALRVVKQMPDWTPGRDNGKAVNVQYTLPVTFRLK